MLEKSKRGGTFSVQFLIGVVVAIACIIMLSILGAKLYGTFERKTDLQQARIQLDKIIYSVENLEEGRTVEVFVEGPKEWMLTSVHDGKPDIVIDDQDITPGCSGNCLCICPVKTVDRGHAGEDYVPTCDLGVCKDIDKGFLLKGYGAHNGLGFAYFESVLTTLRISNQGQIIIEKGNLAPDSDTDDPATIAIYNNFLSFKSEGSEKSIQDLINELPESKDELTTSIKDFYSKTQKCLLFTADPPSGRGENSFVFSDVYINCKIKHSESKKLQKIISVKEELWNIKFEIDLS